MYFCALPDLKSSKEKTVSVFLGSPTPIQWFHPWSQGSGSRSCFGRAMQRTNQSRNLEETCKNVLAHFIYFIDFIYLIYFIHLHPKSSLVSWESNLAMIAAHSSWRHSEHSETAAANGCVSPRRRPSSASPGLPHQHYPILPGRI